ncbi:MAG: penicillin-binding protein [Candidatus Omnitrophica bacterium]|nr:penicillin-binding protein [Candidatus Omnitrophota bacterium]
MKRGVSSRERLTYVFFLALFLLLAFRISYLQVWQRPFYRSLSRNQHYRIVRLIGKRGEILDRRKQILATTLKCYSVFADPVLVRSASATAARLAPALGMDAEALGRKLTRQGRFVWLKRMVPLEVKQQIDRMSLNGIGAIREEKRFYPQQTLAAQVMGLTDIDNRGLEGLELFHDAVLRGKDGYTRILQDSLAREIIVNPQLLQPQPGADVVLTIDSQLQYWSERFLQESIEKYSARRGAVIVMNADNGEILVMANYPFFNPNVRDPESFGHLKNRTVTDIFEPGSVFKMVTLVAALEEKVCALEETFYCEQGQYRIPGTILHDWRPYGKLTFVEVFKKSSNIGVGKIAQKIGPATLHSYMRRLGFGHKTGIDYPGEVSGSLKSVGKWSKTSEYIIPIGQEVGVTLIQLVRAFGVVANGGYLVKPHLTRRVEGEFFRKVGRYSKERVVSQETAARARDILIGVVEEGTGRRAAVKGLRAGGKTGTAQKFDRELGAYSPHDYRATFVGFLAQDPPLVIGVTVDEPRKSHFGGVVAAPVFRQIAEKAARYSLDDRIGRVYGGEGQ